MWWRFNVSPNICCHYLSLIMMCYTLYVRHNNLSLEESCTINLDSSACHMRLFSVCFFPKVFCYSFARDSYREGGDKGRRKSYKNRKRKIYLLSIGSILSWPQWPGKDQAKARSQELSVFHLSRKTQVLPVPSQTHKRGAGSEEGEQLGLEPMPIRDENIWISSLIHSAPTQAISWVFSCPCPVLL